MIVHARILAMIMALLLAVGCGMKNQGEVSHYEDMAFANASLHSAKNADKHFQEQWRRIEREHHQELLEYSRRHTPPEPKFPSLEDFGLGRHQKTRGVFVHAMNQACPWNWLNSG